MRKLFLVPMIHMGIDLGKAKGEITKVKNKLVTPERLEQHEKTISLFWDRVRVYFQGQDVKNMKIFQDGLAAGGEIGKKIVKELALKGSKNFMVVSDLVDKGATAMKTEDVALIQQEQALFITLLQSKWFFQTLMNYLKYKFFKTRLLKKRDRYMAGQINNNLKKGETAVLFIGAVHDVACFLDKDILVFPLKDPDMVNSYLKSLRQKKNDRKFQTLAHKLVSEIKGESTS
ncbi:MAG: TraB/GumN family protein [Proteobacteria bacterium]|nr:TraB/GumN family protein [Pseudomonadota bacterium]MBU1583139.1 TraB/GumN family protein [Pseudomonadota bacterium]MBU2455307.1 TraB/GumN family protein [Pseudomonadota bacterium]MBU2627156.1 TraB/GumN family protein [Pseudomonadota bacterium]